MADGWDQYPAVGQSSSPASGWDQYPAVEQRSSSSGWDQYPAVEEEERKRRARFVREEPGPPPKTPGEWVPVYEPPKDPRWSPGQDPEAEGMLATGLRAFGHEAPAAVGGAAGFATGAGLGSVISPGVGTVIGGLAGAVAGGLAGSATAEEGLKLLGADDSVQRAINAKQNPWSAAIGQGLAQGLGFAASPASTAVRVGGAAIGGALEAGQQLYQGEFDPARLATQTAAGAVFTKPYGWGSRLEAQGAALGERVAQRYHGPASSEGANVATEHIPPTTTKSDVGDAHQERGVGSEINYPNPTNAKPPEAGGGVHVGDVDPTLKAALDAKTADMAPPPAEAPPATEAQRPPMTVSAEDARVTPEMAEVATPREAIEQRSPGETVGNVLRRSPAETVVRDPFSAENLQRALGIDAATAQEIANVAKSEGADAAKQAAREATTRQAVAAQEAAVTEQVRRAALDERATAANNEARQARVDYAAGKITAAENIAINNKALNARLEATRSVAEEAIRRQPIERGRSGRPIETEPLPIGTEGQILERGARKVEEGLAPGKAPPLSTPATPREAIERRAPDETVGGALREAAAGRRQDVLRGPEPEGVGAPAEAQGGGIGGGAQGPPGGPPGTPPPGAAPPSEPPLSAAQQLGQQGKRTLDQLKNIFAPQTRGPQARELANQIRGAYGETTRLNAQTQDILNKYRDTVNAMSQDDLRALVNRAQGGSAFPDWKPDPAQRSFLTDIKRTTDMWSSKLGTLDRAEQMDWIENYLPGMYKNPQANQQFFQDTARRQGGAGSLKQKMFPDYEAARAAGLEPHTNNPIEMLELYGSQMRNFIGKQEVMEKNLKSGTFIKSQAPERIGAAGSPEPQVKSNLPPGYIESRTTSGMYLPEEVAHVWDNFNSAGLAGGRNKDVYGALRSANALWTNLELSLNGYHAFTMANESFISDVAMGIEKIAGGKVISGLKTIAQAPYAPRGRALLGTKVQQSYLDPNSTDPITQSLVKAGFRPIGRSHAADSMLGQKTFLDSFKDLPKQLKRAASETQQGWTDANGDLLQQVAYPFRLAQRAIATASHPLFEVYIPKLKAGAAYSQMEHWREFNPDKIGSAAETEAARKIIDSVDNRYGEMITDHLFMNKVVQDSAVAGMRSFSWFMGSMKEIGGGTYSGARAVARAAIERDPSRLGVLNPANKNYDPRTAYAVAMPMAIAATSAIYQALLGSHDAPESWRDLYAPRTGGMVAGPGGSRVQEHMLMPGYHKDVYGWLAHPGGEAYNKLSGVWSTAIEEARGRGSPSIGSPPFIRPNASFTENVTDRMSYLFSKLGPIGTKAFLKGQKEGSEIPSVMAAVGFHPPGMEIQAPEKIHAIQSKQEKREWKTMTKRANRDALSRGQELPYPPRSAQ